MAIRGTRSFTTTARGGGGGRPGRPTIPKVSVPQARNEQRKREQGEGKEEDRWRAQQNPSNIVYIFDYLYLVFPTLINNHNPEIVKELKRLGVADISIKIVKQKQDFAGRLSLFDECTDRWVLHAIQVKSQCP